MTCIAAVIDEDGTVWMGGDSAGVDENFGLGIGREEKVWENDGILFGASGSFRVSQVLRWHFEVPPPNPKEDHLKYLTGPFVDAMRSALEAAGSLETWEEDSTEGMGGCLLIAYQGRVFEIMEDFGVSELVHGYGAVGCGGSLAWGSLASSEYFDVSAKERVELALDAAERHNAGVRGPMVIIRS